jgi:hypothetical protein
MVLLDHGKGVISHVQSGFNCFNPQGHDGSAAPNHKRPVAGVRSPPRSSFRFGFAQMSSGKSLFSNGHSAGRDELIAGR